MKKITALFLALVAVLTFAFIPVMAEEAVEGDLNFMKAMAFVDNSEDGEIYSDTLLTRIGLAEIFYNIIFPDQENKNEYYGDKDFADVSPEKKHIAATVYGMGVMRGYSEEVFAPDDTVTYNQAIKAIVSFLGYDLYAQNLGGYPSGYLAQATRLQILPGGNISGDAKATYGAVATIFKKAVGVDIAVWNNATVDGGATLEVLKGIDYLNYYRDVYTANGVVTGNYLTDIQGGEASGFFGIYLGGKYYVVDKGAHGIQDLLGYNVYVFYKNNGNVPVAVYYEEGMNREIKISGRDIASVSQGEIKYYTEDFERPLSVSFDVNAPLIYNGTYESTYSVADLNPFTGGKYDGSLKLIDINSDGVYDNIIVSAYEIMVVNDIRNNKIYGMYNTTGNNADRVLDITNYKERNINIRDITGALMTPEGLKKGDVLNVAKNKNGKVKEIIASKDYMTGVIEEIMYKGTKISAVKIAGTTFNCANSIAVIDPSKKLAPGITASVFFGCEAEIALIDVESNYIKGYNTGYLVDAGEEGNLSKKVLCMIYTSEGEMKTYTLPERVSVNGKACDNTEFLNKLGTVGDRVKRQVVLYKTDLDETVLTAIELAPQLEADSKAFGGFYRFPGTEYAYGGGMGTFDNKYIKSDNIKVFGVPSEKERDDYEGYKITELGYGEDIKVTASELYGSRADALMADVAVVSNKITGGNDDAGKRPLFVVSKVSNMVDEKGENRIKVSGVYVERVAIKTGSFLIDPQLLINGHDTGNASDANNGKRPFIDQSKKVPEPGDIYRVSVFDSTGEVDYMNVKEFFQLYDYRTNKFITNSGVLTDTVSGGGTYAVGKVTVKEGGAVKLVSIDNTTPMAYNLSAGSYKFIEISKNKQTGEPIVKVSTENAILADMFDSGDGSKLLLYYRGAGIACIIINDK